MVRYIGYTFLCINKQYPHMTTLVQNIDEFQQHADHNIVKIKTFKNQLNDPNHPMNIGIENWKIANDAINLSDNTVFLLNAVKNLGSQIIGDNSKAISKLFSLDEGELSTE